MVKWLMDKNKAPWFLIGIAALATLAGGGMFGFLGGLLFLLGGLAVGGLVEGAVNGKNPFEFVSSGIKSLSDGAKGLGDSAIQTISGDPNAKIDAGEGLAQSFENGGAPILEGAAVIGATAAVLKTRSILKNRALKRETNELFNDTQQILKETAEQGRSPTEQELATLEAAKEKAAHLIKKAESRRFFWILGPKEQNLSARIDAAIETGKEELLAQKVAAEVAKRTAAAVTPETAPAAPKETVTPTKGAPSRVTSGVDSSNRSSEYFALDPNELTKASTDFDDLITRRVAERNEKRASKPSYGSIEEYFAKNPTGWEEKLLPNNTNGYDRVLEFPAMHLSDEQKNALVTTLKQDGFDAEIRRSKSIVKGGGDVISVNALYIGSHDEGPKLQNLLKNGHKAAPLPDKFADTSSVVTNGRERAQNAQRLRNPEWFDEYGKPLDAPRTTESLQPKQENTINPSAVLEAKGKLLNAILANNVDGVRNAISQRVFIDGPSFEIALKKNNLEVVEALIKGGFDVNSKTLVHGYTYLGCSESPEMAQLLIKNGANVNGRDGVLGPLEHAAYLKNRGVVEVLIRNGADVKAATSVLEYLDPSINVKEALTIITKIDSKVPLNERVPVVTTSSTATLNDAAIVDARQPSYWKNIQTKLSAAKDTVKGWFNPPNKPNTPSPSAATDADTTDTSTAKSDTAPDKPTAKPRRGRAGYSGRGNGRRQYSGNDSEFVGGGEGEVADEGVGFTKQKTTAHERELAGRMHREDDTTQRVFSDDLIRQNRSFLNATVDDAMREIDLSRLSDTQRNQVRSWAELYIQENIAKMDLADAKLVSATLAQSTTATLEQRASAAAAEAHINKTLERYSSVLQDQNIRQIFPSTTGPDNTAILHPKLEQLVTNLNHGVQADNPMAHISLRESMPEGYQRNQVLVGREMDTLRISVKPHGDSGSRTLFMARRAEGAVNNPEDAAHIKELATHLDEHNKAVPRKQKPSPRQRTGMPNRERFRTATSEGTGPGAWVNDDGKAEFAGEREPVQNVQRAQALAKKAMENTQKLVVAPNPVVPTEITPTPVVETPPAAGTRPAGVGEVDAPHVKPHVKRSQAPAEPHTPTTGSGASTMALMGTLAGANRISHGVQLDDTGQVVLGTGEIAGGLTSAYMAAKNIKGAGHVGTAVMVADGLYQTTQAYDSNASFTENAKNMGDKAAEATTGAAYGILTVGVVDGTTLYHRSKESEQERSALIGKFLTSKNMSTADFVSEGAGILKKDAVAGYQSLANGTVGQVIGGSFEIQKANAETASTLIAQEFRFRPNLEATPHLKSMQYKLRKDLERAGAQFDANGHLDLGDAQSRNAMRKTLEAKQSTIGMYRFLPFGDSRADHRIYSSALTELAAVEKAAKSFVPSAPEPSKDIAQVQIPHMSRSISGGMETTSVQTPALANAAKQIDASLTHS